MMSSVKRRKVAHVEGNFAGFVYIDAYLSQDRKRRKCLEKVVTKAVSKLQKDICSVCVLRPVHTPPVAVPVHTLPVAVPVHAQPVAVPVYTAPVAVPVQTQPVAVPVHRPPVAVPVYTAPVAVPVQTQPVAVPVHRPPVAVPVYRPPVAVLITSTDNTHFANRSIKVFPTMQSPKGSSKSQTVSSASQSPNSCSDSDDSDTDTGIQRQQLYSATVGYEGEMKGGSKQIHPDSHVNTMIMQLDCI
eukprot:Lankesteria_metandrocarpae@DN3451_c0_g1_i3.p1